MLCAKMYSDRKQKEKIPMKKMLAIALAALMLLSLAACGGTASDEGKYVIGICQMTKHPSLDQASDGFKDAVIAALGEENVVFEEQDAAGEYATCGVVIDGFIAEGVDLILANSTTPLQVAVSATDEIPILGTSITDYAAALNMSEWSGSVEGNVSGTTDLAPLDQQAAVITELFPDAENVGLLYCSSEPNSVYQIRLVQEYLTGMGYSCTEFAFADVNDMSYVIETACENSDVIYIPTDNTCATYTENIANVVLPAGVPVVTGDPATCAAAGVATFSISYYDLGRATGEMAVQILTGEADIADMPIQPAGEAYKLYNPAVCEQLGVNVPDGYQAVK